MPRVQDALSSTAYALFALQQRISLPELAVGARDRSFPVAANHTPDWFAAAAQDSSLLEMAPELQVLPADLEAAEQVDVTGMDLIHVYAPELSGIEDVEEPAVPVEVPVRPAEQPRTSTQLGLLKELGNLDV
jgi:hypothetical protein